jgi:hypothetical protein
MKLLSLENTSVQTPAVQLARLSGPHGYRFDGDRVHLNAMFALLDPAAHERYWSLQLWACPSAPVFTRDLAGHVVAEVALPPMGELADESEHFEVNALAWPPAGGGEHVMVLVLASGRPGNFNDVHDFAVYARREQFIQPRMSGNVGYRIDGERVRISVERVENPRPASNLSGTLSLELWALAAPFVGGGFQGQHLAGVEIGSIAGQSEWTLQPIDLAFKSPQAGTWQIVLMLREWTADGFVTRDFTNFATPFVSAPIVEKAPEPVIAKAPAMEPAKTVAPAAPAKVTAITSSKGISVNTARVEELAAVKGLTRKLAEGIVKKRPFASLDDLREVKGLGAKILAKVRSNLKV